ncbi:hypothetical protein BGP_0969 [Beggiatoa sp. PS]|nr:hypothetical protein BGP_0969 [Beggiatoa sp. PS]
MVQFKVTRANTKVSPYNIFFYARFRRGIPACLPFNVLPNQGYYLNHAKQHSMRNKLCSNEV